MATDFAYTEDGDLAWDSGGPIVVSGMDELRQALMSLIQTPLGKFINPDVGMDFDWIFAGFDEKAAESAIEQAVLQDARVNSVTKIKVTIDDSIRTINFELSASTTLGDLNMIEEVRTNAIE